MKPSSAIPWLAPLLALAFPHGMEARSDPPALAAPEGAVVLFDGGSTDAWGGAGWVREGRVLGARAGADELVTREAFGDFHLHLDVRASAGDERPELQLGTFSVPLDAEPGDWRRYDVAYQHRKGEPVRASVWRDDRLVVDDVAIEPPEAGLRFTTRPGDESERLVWGEDAFTAAALFRSRADGTLVSKCPPQGEWAPDGKALFLRGGRLVYDIGWVGAMTSERRWNDGEWHTAVLVGEGGGARLYVDGALEAEREDFAAEDDSDFVFKVGEAGDDFGGTLDGDVARARFWNRALDDVELAALLDEQSPAPPAALDWTSDGEAGELLEEGEPVVTPIRVCPNGAPLELANVWLAPLGEVDHAGLIAGWDEESYARGAEIYGGLCVLCHGADGTKPVNPNARPFAVGTLENGADPVSLFATISDGYKDMPSNEWLRPDQRYDVIHYLREEFLRERNRTQYFEVTDAWLNALPKGRKRDLTGSDDELEPRDFGPALASQLGPEIGAGLAIRLDGETTLGYDLQTMESPGTWTGGFLKLGRTQHYQQRGEGIAHPDGAMIPGLDGWGWGHGGTLDWERERRPPRGPLPREWLDYRGYYVHGERLVLSYAIDGREVLELPGVDRSSGRPVITHRLRVAPGDTPLVLGVLRAPDAATPPARHEWEGPGSAAWRAHLAGTTGGTFSAAALRGDAEWRVSGDRLALAIPASPEPIELWLLRAGGEAADQLRGFELFLDNATERPMPDSPSAFVRGGPPRYAKELVTRGDVDEGVGYVVDTLTLPESNPWNAWLRTSALDFFEDGRAAVATLGGDVWVVSGIDADLDELRWRRFATGMFEPLGLRIVEGRVHVTCRDRIVRLHDLNGDGEADFYESFFADPDVTASFHAFSFDLQTDAAGHLFYAKSGQYTDYSLPGAILRVAPDGRSHDVWCTGLRTPNGMGMSPDGRPLISDNQGNWVPASKVSLTQQGGFYGVFESVNRSQPGVRDRDDFDRPVIWMPQSFDSSSGGQLWVDDPRFGPYAEHYLHSSYGKGWLSVLAIDESDSPHQGAVWRFPHQFAAGTQRLRVGPHDGQVYVVGLSGWQGPPGGADGALQRLRWAGGGPPLLLDARVVTAGVELRFDRPLDPDSVAPDGFEVKRWNYLWSSSYGSAHYSVECPGEEGEDLVNVTAATVTKDGHRVRLQLTPHGRCSQLELNLRLRTADGAEIDEQIYMTIYRVPD